MTHPRLGAADHDLEAAEVTVLLLGHGELGEARRPREARNLGYDGQLPLRRVQPAAAAAAGSEGGRGRRRRVPGRGARHVALAVILGQHGGWGRP